MDMEVSANHPRREPLSKASAETDAMFEAVFYAYWPRVYRVLVRLLDDPDEAQDVALEVFWRFYRHSPPDLESTKQAGWLYRTSTRLGLNALRSRKRRKRYEDEAGKAAYETATTLSPEVQAESSEGLEQVRWVLSKIKPNYARILILRYSGLSYKEVANALEISANSVGTILARAEREFARYYRRLEGD